MQDPMKEVDSLKKKLEKLERDLDEKKGEAYAFKQQMQVTLIRFFSEI